MGDPSNSQKHNLHKILGISKNASLSDMGKAYKSLIMKWHPDKNPNNKAEAEAKFSSIVEAYKELSNKKREEANGDIPKTPKKKKSSSNKKEQQEEELQISNPIFLSRTTSRISPVPSPKKSSYSNMPPMDFYTSFPITAPPGTPNDPAFLTKIGSRRGPTPILYSQSAVRRKPPPIEKKLACTLEELCHGCVKKIKITRDAISSTGLIVQEEEILMIQVKPGWKKGTKITFEGKGDERPGTLPADIIFSIDEKRHPIFKREGDDLELGVEVPLVQALTGCTISVPLLGGGEVNLSIEDDIIFPGYEKIVPGQGMTKPKLENGSRGDLKLKFLVEFPTELSDEQRSQVVSILQECN